MRNTLLAALMFLTPIAAVAESSTNSNDNSFLTYSDYQLKKKSILDDLDGGARYMEITTANRKKVLQALDRIGLLLVDVPSEAALAANSLQQLREDEEVINSLLGRAEIDSRLLCKTSASTGSNMLRRRCQTYAKKMARINSDQDAVRSLSRRLSPTPKAGKG